VGGREGGERGGEIFVFFKFFLKGVEENSKFYGEMYFWVMYEEQRYTKYIVIKVNYNNVIYVFL
jgi:hypothetical protein